MSVKSTDDEGRYQTSMPFDNQHEPGGVIKFGFGRDVLLGLWNLMHTNTNFPRKSDPFTYQSAQFRAKFWPKLLFFFSNFLRVKPILAQIKKKKIDPFIYHILHKGHWYTRRLILLPMLAARSLGSFVLSTPPPGSWHSNWGIWVFQVIKITVIHRVHMSPTFILQSECEDKHMWKAARLELTCALRSIFVLVSMCVVARTWIPSIGVPWLITPLHGQYTWYRRSGIFLHFLLLKWLDLEFQFWWK